MLATSMTSLSSSLNAPAAHGHTPSEFILRLPVPKVTPPPPGRLCYRCSRWPHMQRNKGAPPGACINCWQ
jgi:hypothetical protein